MSRIEISGPEIVPTRPGWVRLACRVRGGGLPDTLWTEVRDEDAVLLSPHGNWAAVALLHPAMRIGADLHVDAPLCPHLLDALNRDLQSFLVVYDPLLRPIRVTCRDERPGGSAGALVATGFSAGVDSFATLARYRFAPVHPDLAVTALAVFDVGAFGRDGRTHFDRATARCDAFAAAHGLRPLALASNFDAVYRCRAAGAAGFERTNTLRNAAAALAFENGVRRSYASSSFAPAQIGVRATCNSAYLDPLLLPLLSTGQCTLVSACAGLTRVEKTRLVAALPEAASLLDVCTRPWERAAGTPANCSHCGKCIRTLFTLEALGRLEAFAAVFDLDLFRARRDRLLDDLQASAAGGNTLDREVVELLGNPPTGRRRSVRRRWWF